MESEIKCRIHKGSPVIPILSRINPIPRTDAYFLKIHFNIVVPPTLKPWKRYISGSFTWAVFFLNCDSTTWITKTTTFFHSPFSSQWIRLFIFETYFKHLIASQKWYIVVYLSLGTMEYNFNTWFKIMKTIH